MGQVQKAFNLKKEGAFRISVKNPQAKRSGTGTGFGGPGAGLKDKAEFPEEREFSFLSSRTTKVVVLTR
jgi:hypothetical protein